MRKTQDAELSKFYWQNGYGAFSVNPAQIARVKQYIVNQHEHHKIKSFQEEHRMFLTNTTFHLMNGMFGTENWLGVGDYGDV